MAESLTLGDLRAAKRLLRDGPSDELLIYFCGPNLWRFHRAEALKTGIPFDCLGANAIMLLPGFEIPRP